MLPSGTGFWQPEFPDKTLSRKTGTVHLTSLLIDEVNLNEIFCEINATTPTSICIYYGAPLGKMRLVSRAFEMLGLAIR